MTDYPGIDYGLGQTNIDHSNGIRYGVISSHDVCQSWSDSSESEYGEPRCPKCGETAIDYDDDLHGDYLSARESGNYRSCADYACDDCKVYFGGDEAFGDEPLGWSLDDGEYVAMQSGNDRDIMILKSPFYTRAQFCSPCAPGAGYLTSPCATGPRVYCFGVDWFDSENPCPYPVYRVDEIDPVTGDDPAPRYIPATDDTDGE